MKEPAELKLMTATEAGAILRLKTRTVQARGQQWLIIASRKCAPELPSSPSNGLRPIPTCNARRLYDPRDVDEYLENATREFIGAQLTTWRKDASQ